MNDKKRMTHSELYKMSIEKNYQTLSNCITMADLNSEVSWEKAMETAAITLSEQNAELQAELLRIHQTSIIKIIDNPDGKQVVVLDGTCKAPGCTDKRRGAEYCDKHRQQIKKYGVLRPDLER